MSNRPAELQAPERPLAPEESAKFLAIQKFINEADGPDFIADCTFDAIQSGQFYVVPTEATKAEIAKRMEAILSGGVPVNPLE